MHGLIGIPAGEDGLVSSYRTRGMKKLRKLLNAAAVVVGGAALVMSAQGMANATTSSSAAVPSCVVPEEGYMGTVWVYVTNNCDTAQKVTVVYKNGREDGCHTVQPGEKKYTALPVNISHFDRLISC